MEPARIAPPGGPGGSVGVSSAGNVRSFAYRPDARPVARPTDARQAPASPGRPPQGLSTAVPQLAAARHNARTLSYWFLAGGAWFGLLNLRPLFNPDEGRYAEIPREMLRSGAYVLPRLNDLVYLEKPPLQYWLTALAYGLFGVHPWTARLCTALAAALGVVMVHAAASRLWDPQRAQVAALMTASMLLYVFMGQLLTLDMLLSVTLVAAILAFCLAQHTRDSAPSASLRYALACWLAMALATLTKGLIGIVIPGAILVLYTLVARDWRVWSHLALLRGGALYAAIVVPWFALVERAHPGALWFLIVHEHFQRYLTTVHERYQPAWYFLPILAAGVLPWLPQALRAVATGWRASVERGRFDCRRLLWLSVVLIVAFFSASDSKLAPYVLPVLPLLALLCSADGERGRRDLGLAALLSMATGVLLCALVVLYPHFDPASRNAAVYESAAPWLAASACIVLTTGLGAWIARDELQIGARRLAFGHLAAGLMLATFGASSLSWKYSGTIVLPELAAGLAAAQPGTPIYAFRTYDWTLPVYTGRVLVPVEWRGELDYGLTAEPAKGIAAFGEFARAWQSAPQAFAIVEPGGLAALRAAQLPYRELKAGSELILVSRR